ncbi:hypothetical protein GCM10019059_36800 [Camelimonas fluminis]|uniref:Uncharacterized protein n=1 Tax=Camelimonas fluminis TaxID=1576911 RepID=A0ABV7UIS7_9HYPH|nr:hypothetical protein [Camelimonas fluminis]GHE73891.1 hypothetical protein GCM10019059_36800 [Camelimonas fluminis]
MDVAGELAGAGGGRGMLGRMLSGMVSGNTMRIGTYAALAYAGYSALREYGGFMLGGGRTTYDLRTQAQKDAALGPANMDKASLEKALGTASGREGLAAGGKLSAAVGGRSDLSVALDVDAHKGLSASKREGLAPGDAPGLRGAMSGQVVRVSLPGDMGKSHDFHLEGAVNDESALAEFKKNYGEFSRKNGLPAELPKGASLIIGDGGGVLSSAPATAREYRFVGGEQFEKNGRMRGSVLDPGADAWSADPAFRSGAARFTGAEVGTGSADLVRASSLSEQAAASSLVRQSQVFGQIGDAPVSTPTSFGDRLLGRDGGRDFSEFARSAGATVGESAVVKSVNLETGERSVGIETAKGGVAFTGGASGDRVTMERDDDGVAVFARRSGASGDLGKFDEKGNFQANDAAAHAMRDMQAAVGEAGRSPVVALANGAGVETGKAISIDMTPGNESVTTRVAYGDRVVDYQARNGSMMMIERDPVTHEPRDAAIIRSQGIRVRDGQFEMDEESRGVLKDHVAIAAEGRPAIVFAKMHPETRENFASMADVGARPEVVGPVVGGDRSEHTGVEAKTADLNLDVGQSVQGGVRLDLIRDEGKKQVASVSGADVLGAAGAARARPAGFEVGG